MQAQFDAQKSQAVEFRTKNEPWIKYKLEDGTVLFSRLVVTKIYKTDQYDPAGQPVYAWASQNLVSTVCKPDVRGTPSPEPITSLNLAELTSTPVDFQKIGNEDWNVYEVLDGTVISLKVEISSVLKTERFLPDGDPAYLVNTGVVPKVRVPPNLLKKQTPVLKRPLEKKPLYG